MKSLNRKSVIIAFLLALIPATSGTLRGLVVPGLKISDLITLILTITIIIAWRGRWKLSDGIGAIVAIYSIAQVILTLVNFSARPELLESTSIVSELLAGPQFLLLYLIAYAAGQHKRMLMRVVQMSLNIACVMAVIATAQLFDLGPTRDVLAYVTGNIEISEPLAWKTYRASGLFVSWHAFGIYMAVNAMLGIAMLARARLGSKERRRTLVLTAIVCVGLLTSLTATPILLVGVALLVYGLRTKFVRYVPVVFGTAALLVMTTPVGTMFEGRIEQQSIAASSQPSWLPQTIAYRIDVWVSDYFPLIGENLWTGYGPLGRADVAIFQYTESMYISVLLAGGIPLLSIFLILLFRSFHQMHMVSKNIKVDLNTRAIASAVMIYCVFLMPSQLVHPYLIDAGGAQMFYLLIGLTGGSLFYNVKKSRTNKPGAVRESEPHDIPWGL